MRKLTRNLSAVALMLAGGAGIAYAAPGMSNGGAEVSRAQAQQRAAEHFAKMDANNDGVLDQADRKARRTRHFDRLDANGDGAISREEFATRPERGERRASEMRGNRGKRGHHAMRGGRGMMRMIDSNNDGAIGRAEFAAGALQMFDAADADRDGIVTATERRTAREAMRAQRRENRAARQAQ